ncbi:MAG: vanadium-dependent haloperoxidase [Pseudomonadota bacterium]
MAINRRQAAFEARTTAAQLARDRIHPDHIANGDEERYATAHYMMCFTKGLEHDALGLVKDPNHFLAFRRAIDEGFVDAFTRDVTPSPEKRRAWEAPTAGVVYDLQGHDPQAVTMPPAPALCSDELTFEMAEVYELALVRDVPFTEFEGDTPTAITPSVDRLNDLQFAQDGFPGTRGRISDTDTTLNAQTAFRGSSPGCATGPYLSQFMLIGNPDLSAGATGATSVADGQITYGAQTIDQRVPAAPEHVDYMQTWDDYTAVQNGADTRMNAVLFKGADRRFIATPRDLATYVHDDALYQAYLNACMILLGMRAPFDPGFDALSGMGKFSTTPAQRQAGGFALYGGPHILTLVTEIATRGLKAVRFQKFNNHIRLRPEALAARLEKASEIEGAFPCIGTCLTQMCSDISKTLHKIKEKNAKVANAADFLLPMAFQEGSPMHPAYGAGHATVAGACVTILKAFFDTDAVLVETEEDSKDAHGNPIKQKVIRFKRMGTDDVPVNFVPKADGSALMPVAEPECLTLEGELNKLAANISIGRNMAGVHYYSDYYDSLRMGEEIAIGMLEEQALCYPTDPFVLTVPTFDGPVRRIGRR